MPSRVNEYNPELVKWVHSLYGPGKQFSSARQLSISAGRNANAVGTIEQTGRATAEVIVDIARAARVSPLDALVTGRLLKLCEVQALADDVITAEEREFLRLYRETGPDIRRIVEAGLRAASTTHLEGT